MASFSVVDWCTWFPDLNYGPACCKPHDRAYEIGGTVFDWLTSNLDLGACIAHMGHPGLGMLAVLGTSTAGWHWWQRAARARRAAAPFFSQDQTMSLERAELEEIKPVALAHKQPLAHVAAVLMTESAGTFETNIGGKFLPIIRIEGHIFYRQLVGDERERAVKLGLANPRAGKVKNPASQADRYAMLRRMCTINPVAAMCACSWGGPQVMGMHWKALGFSSVNEFVDRMNMGIAGQVEVMLRFCEINGLDDELREGQWDPFARGYNGPNWRQNDYGNKLRKAAAFYGGESSEPVGGLLRMGSKGRRVAELQTLLVRSGAAVKVDRDFGPTTKAALVAFQTEHGLTPDGIYGPETETSLSALRQSADDRPGARKFLDIGHVKAGFATLAASGVGASQIADLKAGLQQGAAEIAGAGIQSVVLDYLGSALTVAAGVAGVVGLGVMVYGWVHDKKTVEA